MTIPGDHSPDKISGGKPLEPSDRPIRQQPSSQFESHMQSSNAQQRAQMSPQETAAQSPMQMNQSLLASNPSVGTLMAQSRSAQDTLGTVKDQLRTKNLKLKRSQSHLLRNKLTDAHTALQGAGAQLGVNREDPNFSSALTPIDRFISYVDSGQEQLIAMQEKLKEMAAHPDKLNPAQMMLVQVKLSQAQQAVEYSSALLGKVIDAIKTIMNTQL